MQEDAGSNLLHDWIARSALAAPDKTWVVSADDGRTVSYGQLRETVGRFATFLRQRGLGPNDRVALLANNSIEQLLCYFGVMANGATLCTIHVEMNRNQLDNIFERLKPKLILYQDGLQLDDLLAATSAPRLRIGRWDKPEPGTLFAELAHCAPGDPAQAAQPEDDAVILFTSGTSAQPKGVVLNFREYLLNIDPLAAGWGITAADRLYDFRPFSWNSAQTLGALTIVNRGATLVLAAKFSASRFFQHLRDHGVTIAAGNPTTINILLNSEQRAHRDNLPKLRFVTSSSAPLLVEEWKRFEQKFGVPVAQGCGASEVSWIAAIPGEQRRLGTVGKPLAYHDLAIVDADGRRLPPGETGYVELGGWPDHPFRYLGDDGEIKIHSRGRFRTGDLGCLDADGFLTAHRSREGADHPRRRQNLAGRDRFLSDAARRCDRSGHRRRAGCGLWRRGGQLRGDAAGHAGRCRRIVALLRNRAAGLQDAEADRHQRLAAQDRTRQARPPGVGRKVGPGRE